MPIIFLTGRKIDEITPEEALDSGIDDFVTKPWRPDELVARVKAVMRRTFAVPDNSTDLIRYGDITLDISRKRVLVQNKEVHFGNILFLLIKKFLQHPGKLLTYDDLIAYVWNKTATARQEHKNTLRVHVTNLKKALGNKYSKYLHTVHGEGYVWEE